MTGPNRDNRIAWIAATAVLVLLALALWQVNRLRPPSSFRMATGPENTQSHRTGLRYAEAVSQRGFRMDVIPGRGPLDVIGMLQGGEAEAGIIDNTSSLQHDLSGIEALVAIYPEPLWIFYRDELDDDAAYDALSDLSGRISIGEIDSGSNELARLLFELSEVDAEQIDLVALPDDIAASQLLSGNLNAAIMSGGINSDPVLQLLTSPDIELLNLRRIRALEILVPFLSPVLMPEGVVRLSANLPDEDKNMMATKAVLATRADLHPDLQRLLIKVAEQEHEPHRWFENPGEYPATDGVMMDLSPVAMEYHEGGPSYLERYLPFWIASPIERFYLLVLPMLVLLYPLMRGSPSVYRGVMYRRINRWYAIVHEAEIGLPGYTLEEVDTQIARLSELSTRLSQSFSVPKGYMERYYSLRLHIRLVLDELRERRHELLENREEEHT